MQIDVVYINCCYQLFIYYLNIAHNYIMGYYNYHAQCKKLINSSHLLGVAILPEYKHIKPAMVFYFDNHKPMPIREYKWAEYLELVKKLKIKITNKN